MLVYSMSLTHMENPFVHFSYGNALKSDFCFFPILTVI